MSTAHPAPNLGLGRLCFRFAHRRSFSPTPRRSGTTGRHALALVAALFFVVPAGFAEATRSFDVSAYQPGVPIEVTLTVGIETDQSAFAIEEVPPSGWTVDQISDNGVLRNGRLRWGPFLEPGRTLSYRITPPTGEDETQNFSGVVSVDGTSASVGGEASLDPDQGGPGGDGGGPCTEDDRAICLADERFAVRVRWTSQQGGAGDGIPIRLTADTAYFWFFNRAAVEVVVKVIDACIPPFNKFWVFAGGLTNQGVEITVTDSVSELSKSYSNPLGTKYLTVADQRAFDTCPAN